MPSLSRFEVVVAVSLAVRRWQSCWPNIAQIAKGSQITRFRSANSTKDISAPLCKYRGH